MRRRGWGWPMVALWTLLAGCGERVPVPAQGGSPGVGSEGGVGNIGAGGGNPGDAGSSAINGGSSPGVPTSAGGGATSSGGAPPRGEGDGAAGQAGSGDGCGAAELDGLSVFSPRWDPLGYPPYALDGCRLVYVAPEDGGGALYLRDLTSGEATLLEAPEAQPRRPSIAGGVIAWEIDEGGRSRVRVRQLDATMTLGGEFDHAGEPRATLDAVVFTAFLGSDASDDSDVYLYDVTRDALTAVATGPGQQRFADVSLTHVAVTDFSEDPHGYFNEVGSISDILLVERGSGTKVSRAASGKQAFPLLGSGDALVYLDWGEVHPEPKFSQFWLKAGRIGQAVALDRSVTVQQIHTDTAYVRPSLRDRHVDFVDTRAGAVALYRAELDREEEPAAVPLDVAAQLFGPVTTDELTLISKPLAGQSLSLLAVAR